jgi:hypothetical protein
MLTNKYFEKCTLKKFCGTQKKTVDWLICHTIILILEPKFRLFSLFFTPKSIFFRIPCKILGHTIILILGSKFWFGLCRLIFTYLTPKIIFFLTPCKILDLWIYLMTILILAPNSVCGLWRLFCTFLTPKSIYFFAPCKILDRWIYHMTILILAPKFRFWALKAYFRIFDPQKYILSCSM